MKNLVKWTDYLNLGLYTFLGLGMEVVLISIIEPFIFKAKSSQFTTSQTIIHWIATIVIWGLFAYYITKVSREKYNFDYFKYQEKMNIKQWIFALVLILIALSISIWNWNGLKIFKEINNLGLLKFIFQYIYYFMETVLIVLIVIFGQKSGEAKFGKSNIPWGGIMVGATWGMIHMLTQGDIFAGLHGLFLGLLYGVMYLTTNKNIRIAYFLIAAMFIL